MLAKLLKPFHFKVFFSNKYVHGMVLDKVTNVVVASLASNNYAFTHHLGEKQCKTSEKACELLGRMLAEKMKAKEVPYNLPPLLTQIIGMMCRKLLLTTVPDSQGVRVMLWHSMHHM